MQYFTFYLQLIFKYHRERREKLYQLFKQIPQPDKSGIRNGNSIILITWSFTHFCGGKEIIVKSFCIFIK